MLPWSKGLGCSQSLIHSSIPLTMHFEHFCARHGSGLFDIRRSVKVALRR